MTYAEAIQFIPQGKYRDYKGRECTVICIAKHTKDREPLVIYQEQWGSFDVEARPVDEWYKPVDNNGTKRYTKIW